MTSTHQSPPIRRRTDGSIDTTYYMARGRTARSHEAYAILRHLKIWLSRPAALPERQVEAPRVIPAYEVAQS